MTLSVTIPAWLPLAYVLVGQAVALALLVWQYRTLSPSSRSSWRSRRYLTRMPVVWLAIVLAWPWAAGVTIRDAVHSRRALAAYRRQTVSRA